MASKIEVKDLLEAGVHFGHLTRKWNPNMAPYIYMERNGIHVINLYKTVAKLDEANEALKKRPELAGVATQGIDYEATVALARGRCKVRAQGGVLPMRPCADQPEQYCKQSY